MVVKPFFTWNNSFNLNNEQSNSKEKKQEHFLQYIMHFVNPNMWMLTFNVILGYQGLLFRDLLWFFLGFLFQSYRPIQYQEMHWTLNEKKGDGLNYEKKKDFICFSSHPNELNNCSVKTDKLLSVLRTEQTHFPQKIHYSANKVNVCRVNSLCPAGQS